jgi:acetyltransferase-like isoleucine patch superfamily enzyme
MLCLRHAVRNVGISSHSLFASITDDTRPLPSPAFADDPWVCGPVHADYGMNIKLGIGAFINFNSTFVDTCPISIGARTLVGPNCSFYSGTHPLDPALRMGTTGPELGKPIDIGEDCWFGGNVIVLPGITIGRGCSIGAGSVVTKVSPDLLRDRSYVDSLFRISLPFTSPLEILLGFYGKLRQLWTLIKLPLQSLRMRL